MNIHFIKIALNYSRHFQGDNTFNTPKFKPQNIISYESIYTVF